ncbi:MAG: arginine repressor [Firmicutes bacterium]|nr:arginine repressor [Bacillota bacterium]
MPRSARQIKILELIGRHDLETQDELAGALVKAGFPVTQATISRDIKELGLVKISVPDGRQKYARDYTDTSVSGKVVALFRQAAVSIDYALNTVVIKTLSGSANSAGLMVDRIENPQVLGCVAGDDTVLVITKSEAAAKKMVETLNKIIYS